MASSLPCWVSRNGVLLAPTDAHISIFNPALFGAFGVYESIQLHRGRCFRLQSHLERLAESAARIELALPVTLDALAGWVEHLVAAERDDDALVRLFVLGASPGYPAELFIWLEPPRTPSVEAPRAGVGAVTFEGERALPLAKSLNTLVNHLARAQAVAAGEHEGLLVNHAGCLTEGASSNLFVVEQGVLCTAPQEEVLAGVTQIEVLHLAAELGLPVVQRPLPLAEVARWDEAFLTSTSRHVLPLVRVDGQLIGDGLPGPLTRRLQAAFEEMFEATLSTT